MHASAKTMPPDSESASEGYNHIEEMSANSKRTCHGQAIGGVSEHAAVEDLLSISVSRTTEQALAMSMRTSPQRELAMPMGISPQRERITKEVNELKAQQQRVQLCQDEAEDFLNILDEKLTHLKLLHRESNRSRSTCMSSGSGKHLAAVATLFSSEGSREPSIEVDEKVLSLRRRTESSLGKLVLSSLDSSGFSNSSFSEDALPGTSRSDSLKKRCKIWVKSMGDALDSENEGIGEDGHRDVFSEDDVIDEPRPRPSIVCDRSPASSADVASPDSDHTGKEKAIFIHWIDSQDDTWV